MKAKKLFGILLAGAMALSAVAGLAACGGGKDPDTPVNPNPPVDDPTDPNKDWEGTVYTLVGVGSGEALWTCNWDQKGEYPGLTFKGSYAEDGVTEVHTLTIDLYEGDEFQIIHGHDWAGQMGFSSVADAGMLNGESYFVAAPGGGQIQNINIATGKSGKYELTLTVAANVGTITFKQVESYAELALVKFVDQDNNVVGPSNANFNERGRYYKKGATVPAIPFAPDEALTPPMMAFVGFEKVTGETATKWEEGPITENMTLRYKYEEDANPDFVADKADAAYYLVGTSKNGDSLLKGTDQKVEALKLEKQTQYKTHNVYVLNEVALYADDEIMFAWGENETSRFEWITNARNFTQKAESELAIVAAPGYYSIRLNVILDKDQKVTDMQISISKTGAILADGWYFVGTYKGHTDAWWDDPENAIFLTQDKNNPDIWTADITITSVDFVPKGWDDNPNGDLNKAALKIKWYQHDGQGDKSDYGVGSGSGTAGSGNILLGEGTWTVTFDAKTHTVSWVEKQA